MAKRWAFSPITGDGQSNETAYRVTVGDLPNTNTIALIPTDNNGAPIHTFALCRVATANIQSVIETPNVYVFPESSLDHVMSSIGSDPNNTNDVLFAMNQAIQVRGLDHTFWQMADSYRSVINGIGKQHDSIFDADRFDVSEVFD